MAFIEDPLAEAPERPRRFNLSRAARFMVDLVLPPRCPACAVEVQEPATLCPQCWAGLSFISRPFCERTATPFVIDPGPGIYAASAYQYPPLWQRARAAVLYEGTAPGLVHALKYSDRHEVVTLMAGAMAKAGQDVLAECDLIIPVPLHRWRLWKRRFNQAALLARRIAGSGDVPFRTDILLRRKATASQVGLSREGRARNLAGAFAIAKKHRNLIKKRRIVLIDDVLTTGATLNAACRVLQAAGADHIDVVVFARATDAVALA